MDKVFITGVYGSGKTTFAKKYAEENELEYVSFDHKFNYQNNDDQAKQILSELPKSFVIDAIPFDKNSGWKEFANYEKNNKVGIICVYCPDAIEWIKRTGIRAKYSIPKGKKNRLKFSLKVLINKFIIPDNISSLLTDYRNYFIDCIPWLEKFKNVKYYNSLSNEYTTKEKMLESVNFKCFELENHLNSIGKKYDYKYQDIEIIKFIGYSESYKTWEELKDIVDWKNKTVCDLGCFHGYFAFKVEDAGGRAIGLERSDMIIDTARMINKVRGGNVRFEQWNGGDEIPDCDITLCLNVLHHFREKKELALSKMKSKKVIFEINKADQEIVEKYFKDIKEFNSHRKDRVILLCQNQ